MKKSLLLSFSLCFSLFFIACQKDGVGPADEENPGTGNPPGSNPPGAASFRLVKMIQGTPLTKDTTAFLYYDASGRFGGFKESMTPDSFAIVYPTDPLKAVEADMARFKLAKTEYFYDASKKLVKLIDRTTIFEFEYNTKGLISKIGRTTHDGAGNPAGGTSYETPTYDANDNLVKIGPFTATYTSLPNMFKGMEVLTKMISFDLSDLAMTNTNYGPVFSVCSKYMPATMKIDIVGQPYDFKHTYETDKDNNIIGIKSVSSGAGNMNVTYTRKFEYEKIK